ncbi:hypothetical protein BH23CHL5_BH23CHL5_03380 [soil metagenome]
MVWQTRLSSANSDRVLDAFLERMREIVGAVAADPQRVEPPHGTVNFICQDRAEGESPVVSAHRAGRGEIQDAFVIHQSSVPANALMIDKESQNARDEAKWLNARLLHTAS